jgi:hypothetical protein
MRPSINRDGSDFSRFFYAPSVFAGEEHQFLERHAAPLAEIRTYDDPKSRLTAVVEPHSKNRLELDVRSGK